MMKRKTYSPIFWLKLMVSGLLLLTLSIFAWPTQADDDDDEYVDGQVVVKLNLTSGVTIEEVNATYGTSTLNMLIASSAIYLLEIAPEQDVEEVVETMEDDPRLLYAEPNFIGESPEANPSETWAWGGNDPDPMLTQYAGEMVNLEAAHLITLGAGVVVAVIDTGAQLDHPGLATHFTAARYDFVDDDATPEDEFNGIDNDGDSWIDEAAGHGTHVSGIVHLVAPEAQIMPLRVLDSDGRGNIFLAAEAILFALQNGAHVINLSLGTTEESDLMEDMIEDAVAAGVVVVAAAGNLNSSSEQYPAAETDVIAVTAIGPDGVKSPFANYGEWVDVAAPGESIYSTFPTDGYAQWSGTSMATPFVSGQAALIRSVNGNMSVAEILATIQTTAQSLDEMNPGYPGQLGAGQIDIGISLANMALFRILLPIILHP